MLFVCPWRTAPSSVPKECFCTWTVPTYLPKYWLLLIENMCLNFINKLGGPIMQLQAVNSIKNGPYLASFSLFSSFQSTVDSKQMFSININPCRWLDSNRGPLVSEGTALPTEPQPLTPVFNWAILDQFLQILCYANFLSSLIGWKFWTFLKCLKISME